jgi:hypothetical protein
MAGLSLPATGRTLDTGFGSGGWSSSFSARHHLPSSPFDVSLLRWARRYHVAGSQMQSSFSRVLPDGVSMEGLPSMAPTWVRLSALPRLRVYAPLEAAIGC